MKSRRRIAPDDHQAISHPRNALEAIPTDLIMEILARLPAKSIARCRCVSKPWASMFRLPYFTELFFTISRVRPQLLITCLKQGELCFLSTPQVINMDENSSLVPTSHRIKFAFDAQICGSVRGLVCFACDRDVKEEKYDIVPVICNPSTGQSLTLPKVKEKSVGNICSFFGDDPILKQFKVLSMMTYPRIRRYGVWGAKRISEEHQILTLGTKKTSWRKLECSVPHYPISSGVCINGILYYKAGIQKSSWITSIVCFDVRLEKFGVIERAEAMSCSTLVNYKGKLAALVLSRVSVDILSFEMWVLEDPEKHVWSKHVYEMPPMLHDIVEEGNFYIVGLTGTNEVVMCPRTDFNPFYVLYYNIESKTFRRVEIQGMDAFQYFILHISVDHVEDVKFMDMFRTYNLRSLNRS